MHDREQRQYHDQTGNAVQDQRLAKASTAAGIARRGTAIGSSRPLFIFTRQYNAHNKSPNCGNPVRKHPFDRHWCISAVSMYG